MPRSVGHREPKCKACMHTERVRIDWLIASGAQIKPLAVQFGLKASGLYNHSKKHISDSYVASVRLGPFKSEAELQRLCAENGSSVIEQLRAMNSGVQARWLAAFEAGADDQFVHLTGQFRKNLELMAKLTKELAPHQTNITNNNTVVFSQMPEFIATIAVLADALREFPDARLKVAVALRKLDPGSERPLIELKPVEAA